MYLPLLSLFDAKFAEADVSESLVDADQFLVQYLFQQQRLL